MNNYIIEIDGVKITWFDDFLNSGCNKIGLRFSGGVESSLLLWMLCYFCNLSGRHDIEIYPFFMRDWYKKIPSKAKYLKLIINYVQTEFPQVNLKPLDLTMFWSAISKDTKLEPSCEKKENYLRKAYGIQWFINGINLNLNKEEFLNLGITEEEYETRDARRDKHRILTSTDSFQYDILKSIPFYNVTKITIKKLYQKYGLMETIYPWTDSCLSDKLPFPCKKCLWCKERYAIFGSYDYGIQ